MNSDQTKTSEKKALEELIKLLKLVGHACFLIMIFSIAAEAQPGLPGPPSQAPIDGGLSLLAAAGGAYAIKKLRDKSTEREEDQI